MNLPVEPQLPDPLDSFENSMEQPIPLPPEIDLYADPLCRQLDAHESSIENQDPLGLPLSDALHGVLDSLENSVEQQGPLEPNSEQVLPTRDLANSGTGRFGLQGQVGGPEVRESNQDSKETSAESQHSARIPKMRGRGGSGVRNSSDESGQYCYLHEKWVTEDECESCPDFEEDEFALENRDEKRCKHSIFRAPSNGSPV